MKDLKDSLIYNPDTGIFTWAINRYKKRKPRYRNGRLVKSPARKGDIVGYKDKSNGYLKIAINGEVYLAHRLAWFFHYNIWPINIIDHINHNKLDNRIINLRDVTESINHKNLSKHSNNTSGITGVYKNNNRWIANINIKGTQIHIGTFNTFDEAVNARKEAEVKYDFHVNHGKTILTIIKVTL